MIAPIARILGRYVASALVTYGLLDPGDAAYLEPEFIALAGLAIAAAVEAGYAIAKRKGWAT